MATKNQIVTKFSLEEAITSHIESPDQSSVFFIFNQNVLTGSDRISNACAINTAAWMTVEDCRKLGSVDLHFKGLKYACGYEEC